MCNSRLVTLSLLLFTTTTFCRESFAEAKTYTLDECFQLALKRSDTIARNVEQINQTEAQIRQAQANYLPTIAAQGSYMRQAAPTSPIGASLMPTSQTTTNLNLTQNLFQGFKDLATVRQRRDQTQAYEAAKRQALVQLYKDTAQAFYTILSYQSDLQNYRDQIESHRKRREELLVAKRNGRARESDVVTVESSIASLEATVANIEEQMVTYQEVLRYLTGLETDSILSIHEELPITLHAVENWLEKIEQRPDIAQSKAEIDAAKEGVTSAKSGHLPTVSLGANYYLSRPGGLNQGVDWDTTLSVSIPIFSGGLVQAQVAEAESVRHEKELAYHQAKEQATQNVRTVYRTVAADYTQLNRLAKARDLAKRSYTLMHQDNMKGLVTNTDVLNSMSSALEAKRNLDRQRINALYDYARLLAESAQLKLEDVGVGK